MHLKYHGGGCCGINHICFFPPLPKSSCPEFTAKQAMESNKMPGWTYYVSGYEGADLPPETGEQRLKRLIKLQTGGMIEVVLTENQTHYWRKCLEENGFKEVNSFYNPNSAHTCFVFHHNLRR